MNLTRNQRVAGSIPGLPLCVKDLACHLVWVTDTTWILWLWCRPEAVALIQPLAWEPPCAMGEALKSKQTNKKLDPCSLTFHPEIFAAFWGYLFIFSSCIFIPYIMRSRSPCLLTSKNDMFICFMGERAT